MSRRSYMDTIVAITWEDHSSEDSDRERRELRPSCTWRTFGQVVREDATCISVARDVEVDGTLVSRVQHVLRAVIAKIEVLSE